ncbi:MAG TPA: DegT/DnrJ/EryC1/StrS family aminotransferase [Terriglobales bacterium]|nr:DegT/DnrJ/EryC1/StrS family aminotransferase [Terriglobales bacterium]
MKAQGNIPFLDLITPHLELEEELVAGFRHCLRSAHFIGGTPLEEFEREFAAFCGAAHAIGVANGTDAVRFALMAAGVEAGDVVITVPNTFIATTEAITQAGARPAFVDIDESTYSLDPERLAEFLEEDCWQDQLSGKLYHAKSGRPVTAIVPVHLYGQMANLDPIQELAERYGLMVIEDACQAHGAEYHSARQQRWVKAGAAGKAAAFSFYPGKNLGACGEAGAVTTADAEVARKIRMLRDHGQSRKYYHDVEGYNGRLDTIQAGILRAKLKHLAGWNEQRRQVAREYSRLFAAADAVQAPQEPAWSKSVYHLYVVRVANREKLQAELGAAGIGTAIHYPIPLHLQKAYQRLGYRAGDFPAAERVAPEILSLPMYPQLALEKVRQVAEKLLQLTGPRRLAELSVG